MYICYVKLVQHGMKACLRGCAVTQQPEAWNSCEISTLAALKRGANRLMSPNLRKSAATVMNSIKHKLSIATNMLCKDLTRTKEFPAGGFLIPIKVISWRVMENEGRFIANSDFFFPSLSHASGRKIRSVLGAFSLNLTAGYSPLPWDLQHWSTQAVPLWIPFSVFFFGLCGVVVICTYGSTEKNPKPKQQQQQKTNPKQQTQHQNQTKANKQTKQPNKKTPSVITCKLLFGQNFSLRFKTLSGDN